MPLPYDAATVFDRPFTKSEPVHGGDINRAFCLYGTNTRYFLKINDAALYHRMFEQEAAGLAALQNNCSLVVPGVIQYGVYENQQYLLLNWLEKGQPLKGFWERFGRQLAQLHQCTYTHFGFTADNYIGSLPQRNTYTAAWAEFYTLYRIEPLVKRLYNGQYFNTGDVKAAHSFCSSLPQFFPDEPPALLHGDLWSGNFMVAAGGTAAIFDPAVYYGHREMDIGMSRLFGGFDRRFYTAYNEAYPLQPGWEQRLPCTQLYPVLVHAVLFGGHYVQSCREILAPFRPV